MMTPKYIRVAGQLYRKAAAPIEKHIRGSSVQFWVHALVSSKTGTNLPGTDSGLTKKRNSIPRELKKSLSRSQELAAKEALDQDSLWYIKIEGKGWEWTKKNGAKHAEAVHSCLEFLDGKAPGLIYAEIDNKIG